MATVRITSDLREQIIANAQALFNKRRAALQIEPINRDDPKLGDEMLANWFAQQPWNDIWDRVPDEWKMHVSSIHVDNVCGVRINGRFAVTPQFVPLGRDRYGRADAMRFEITDPVFDHIGEKWQKWSDDRAALNEETNRTVRTTRAFVDSHTTLRKALAEWPGLWELTPQWAKDAHNRQEKVEKKASAASAGVDVDSLTAAIVKAKFVEKDSG